jgi:hypothetical protein
MAAALGCDATGIDLASNALVKAEQKGPHRLAREDITATFTDGWRIDTLEPTTIEVTIDPSGIRAWFAALTRL